MWSLSTFISTMFETDTQNYKQRVGKVLRTHSYTLYWRIFLLYWWVKNKYYLKKLTSNNLFKSSVEAQLKEQKNSNTIFILGSGSSINNISENQWNIIENNDSVGLNKWFIHNHIPNYYVMEFPENEWKQTYYAILRLKADQYRDVPILIKNISTQSSVLDLSEIPKTIHDNIYLTNGIPLPWDGKTIESFENTLRYLDQNGYFNESEYVKINFQRRGSISYLILLAVQLGYDEIVLCGVDMLHSDYFFQNSDYGDFAVSLPNIQSGSTHKTYDSKHGKLTLDKVIYAINRVVLEPRGIDLYVGSKPTALYPNLDYYFEERSD